ncbi:MAG: 50S ribosomal protein L7ae [Firmicutes bacterium]|nr:50S ribosomal protein L7ae [Bacillota bacterium]
MLGLARRAGRLFAGTETVVSALKRGRVDLVVMAVDLSPATKERLARLAAARGVQILTVGNREALARATGCPGRGVYGVAGHELAAKIASSLASLREAEMVEGGDKDS